MTNEFLFLSEADVQALISPREIIDIVEDVFVRLANGDGIYGAHSRITVDPAGKNFFMTFLAGLNSLGIAGTKWYSGFACPQPGFPFSHGSFLTIADLHSGTPLAIMGATALTHMRTAGGHGVVGAKYLSVPEPVSLGVIGCGAQGNRGIQGFLTQFPSIKEVFLYDSVPAVATATAQRFQREVHVKICSRAGQVATACRLILLITSSQDIVLQADDIQPGTTVIGLNGFQDLDPAIVEKATKWVVGNRREDLAALVHSPALRHGYPLFESQIWADLSEIITGAKAGRQHNQEIIVFTHMGMGFFDIACGKRIYEKALTANVGQHLYLNASGAP